jgi:hypothetical protein
LCVPVLSAVRGAFPLNGTYFQVRVQLLKHHWSA